MAATLQYHPEKHVPSFLSALIDAPEKWMGDLLYPMEDPVQDHWTYEDLSYRCDFLDYFVNFTWNTCAAGGDRVFATILRRFFDLRHTPILS